MSKSRNTFIGKLKIFRILGLIIFMLILICVLILLFCRIEETVEGRGVVAGQREYRMKSKVNTIINGIYARSGDTVKKGTVLLTLNDQEFQENLLRLKNDITELKARINMTALNLEVVKSDPLPKEYRHSEISFIEAQQRESYEKSIIEAYKTLRDKNAVSAVEYSNKMIAYLKSQGDMQRFNKDVKLLNSGLPKKIIDLKRAELELLKVQLKNLELELNLYKKHFADYRFIAPEDGTVTDMPTKTGIYVSPGDSLVSFAALGDRKFIAYINEKDIYKVAEEQKVRIASSQYNYFKYGYFSGKVYAIDQLPMQHGIMNCYAVRIRLNKHEKKLRLGSTGNAEIMVGKNFIFRILMKY